MIVAETISRFPAANAVYSGFGALVPYSYLSGVVVPPPVVRDIVFGSLDAMGRMYAGVGAQQRMAASLQSQARLAEGTIRII